MVDVSACADENGTHYLNWPPCETVNVLGTPYSIKLKKYDDDAAFARDSIGGYCDSHTRQLVVCDMSTVEGWEHCAPEMVEAAQKRTLRHEIIHAFLSESGLEENAFGVEGPWAKNEEMVDWFAIQGPKVYRAWQEAGCL